MNSDERVNEAPLWNELKGETTSLFESQSTVISDNELIGLT